MVKETVSTKSTPVKRTSAGLRDALFDELDMLRNDQSNPARANAVAKLADQVVGTVVMELEVQRTLARIGSNQENISLPKPISLGA